MINLRIHPEVADDLNLAKAWYLEIDPELAESFLDEAYHLGVMRQILNISRRPVCWFHATKSQN